jgi:hypothetical protein
MPWHTAVMDTVIRSRARDEATDEVRKLLRQECEHAGSQTAWAKANGMAAAYV